MQECRWLRHHESKICLHPLPAVENVPVLLRCTNATGSIPGAGKAVVTRVLTAVAVHIRRFP
jgi:hypothetical protein